MTRGDICIVMNNDDGDHRFEIGETVEIVERGILNNGYFDCYNGEKCQLLDRKELLKVSTVRGK